MSATIFIHPSVKIEHADATQSLVVTLSDGVFKRLKALACEWNVSESEAAGMMLTEAIVQRGKGKT